MNQFKRKEGSGKHFGKLMSLNRGLALEEKEVYLFVSLFVCES